jgi:hypothetical protein
MGFRIVGVAKFRIVGGGRSEIRLRIVGPFERGWWRVDEHVDVGSPTASHACAVPASPDRTSAELLSYGRDVTKLLQAPQMKLRHAARQVQMISDRRHTGAAAVGRVIGVAAEHGQDAEGLGR